MKHTELKLTGSGGQGLILAGVIMAEAGLLEGKKVIQSQSYGPEARGGASKAEVIISDSAIDFIKVQNCDMLLCLTQAAYDKYGKGSARLLIIDDRITLKYPVPAYAAERAFASEGSPPVKVVKIPILNSAADNFKKPMVANIIALGAINGIMNIVSKDALSKAVLNRVPKGTEDLNRSALEWGYELIKSQ